MEGDIETEVGYATIGIPLSCVHTRMHVCCPHAPIRVKAIWIVCCMSFHLCYKKTRLYIANVVVCMCMGGGGYKGTYSVTPDTCQLALMHVYRSFIDALNVYFSIGANGGCGTGA